jgi:hypothetical protein
MNFMSSIMQRLTGIVTDALAKTLESKQGQVQENKPPVVIPLTERKAVNIVIDRQVRQKYQQGWIGRPRVAGLPVTEFVVHGTAGGTDVESFLRWMLNGERAQEYVQGIALFHYFIGRDGTIVEVIDPQFWVWHSSSGAHDKQTIGCELINPSKINDEPYTDAQYKALAGLIAYLLPLYPSLKHVVSHNVNQQTYSPSYGGKQCPGAGFDWARFVNLVNVEVAKTDSVGFESIWLKRG